MKLYYCLVIQEICFCCRSCFIERMLRHQDRIDAEDLARRHQKRVAVRRRMGDDGSADIRNNAGMDTVA